MKLSRNSRAHSEQNYSEMREARPIAENGIVVADLIARQPEPLPTLTSGNHFAATTCCLSPSLLRGHVRAFHRRRSDGRSRCRKQNADAATSVGVAKPLMMV